MATVSDISCIPVSELEHSESIDKDTLFLASQFDSQINQYVSKKLTAEDLSSFVNQNTNWVDKDEATTDIGLNEPFYYVTGIRQRDGKITGLLSAHFPSGGMSYSGSGVIDGTLATSTIKEVGAGQTFDSITYTSQYNSWLAIRGIVTVKTPSENRQQYTYIDQISYVPTLDLYIGNNIVNQVELDGFHEGVYFTNINWFGIPVREGSQLTLKLSLRKSASEIEDLKFQYVPNFQTKIDFYEYQISFATGEDEKSAAFVQKAEAIYTDPHREGKTFVKFIDQTNGQIRPVHDDLPIWQMSLTQSEYDSSNSTKIATFHINNEDFNLYAPTAYSAVVKSADKIEHEDKTYIRIVFNTQSGQSDPIVLDVTKMIPDMSMYADLRTDCPIRPISVYRISTNKFGQVVQAEPLVLGSLAEKSSVDWQNDIDNKPRYVSTFQNDAGYLTLSSLDDSAAKAKIETTVNAILGTYVKKSDIDNGLAEASEVKVPSTNALIRDFQKKLREYPQLSSDYEDVKPRATSLDMLGRVTQTRNLIAQDIPNINISQVTGLQVQLDSKQQSGNYVTEEKLPSAINAALAASSLQNQFTAITEQLSRVPLNAAYDIFQLSADTIEARADINELSANQNHIVEMHYNDITQLSSAYEYFEADIDNCVPFPDYSAVTNPTDWSGKDITTTGLKYTMTNNKKCTVIFKFKSSDSTTASLKVKIGGNVVEDIPSVFVNTGIRIQYSLPPNTEFNVYASANTIKQSVCSLTVIPEKEVVHTAPTITT